jgi:hypothetical protein
LKVLNVFPLSDWKFSCGSTFELISKLFSKNIKYAKKREGERFKSTIIKSIRGKKIIDLRGKIALEDYVNDFKKKALS